MTIKGRIRRGMFGYGSKSEHNSLYLETDQGRFLLRKKGENPFQESSLANLEGKMVTVVGTLDAYLLIADEVCENH
jgi:hypothetical protein